MQDINVAIVQTDLIWEDVDKNLLNLNKKIDTINTSVDLIVLPEMFNTAFSMNPLRCAEPIHGIS